jgi:hypothetical protein
MRIYGIDFTSRPTRRKPITCLEATLEGTHLNAGNLTEWPSSMPTSPITQQMQVVLIKQAHPGQLIRD